jgi:hypothetical protein
MKKDIILFLFAFTFYNAFSQPIIIDHNCIDVLQIQPSVIDDVKANIRFQWCGQSHSGQIPCGLEVLEGLYPQFNSQVQEMVLPTAQDAMNVYIGNQGFDAPGQCCTSITPEGYWVPPTGPEWTNDCLTYNPTLNVSGFLWCWQLESNNAAYVQAYLNQMEIFEQQYPNVTFVYTTANAQAYGEAGLTRHTNNEIIRNYCIAHNKVLFDFGDIDCWYNGVQNTTTFNGVTYPVQSNAFDGQVCGHVNLLGAEYKARAIWWMMAMIRGFNASGNQAPIITNQTFSIAENSPNGQQVGIVVASDPDAGQTLTYSIISGNTNNAFAINSTTGALTVNNCAALNYEVITAFGLSVKVQDNGQGNLYSQATVTVNLTNVNENPNMSNQTFSIAENSPNGQQVGIVIATDPDAGQTLTYSIISGNTNNAFAINSTTGTLTVNTSSALNYEVITTFGLTVKVQDNGEGNLYSQAMVTVNLTNVNENPNISNQTFSIAENSPNGQQVGVVVATDPDAGQTLTYSIISGNTNNAFTINSATGALTVNNTSALNYEVITSFGLTVRAQDNGQGNLYSQATVSVNITEVNEQPQIENQTYFVAENTPNGQAVATVIAADPDNGQSLLFSITAGNTDNAFIINLTTGVITVNNSSALNILNNPNFYLTVVVQDNGQGNLTNQALITMTLTDVNQQPVISDQTFDIEENTPNGQVVGTVYATDPDFGQTLTYSIISGNTNYAFVINSSTGDLSVNNSSGLNFEVTPTFNLIVEVQDNGAGNLWAQASITINITDVNESPEINDQTFAIEEYSPNGTEVGTLVATDPDNGQTLTYSILSGNENNAFILNSTTRVLTVGNSSALDFETNPVFSLVVKVTDDGIGNLTDDATITVNLSDVNENPEINDQSFAIEEYSQNGTEAGTLVATDPDNGQTLTYDILSGNENNAFLLNSATGVLTVGNSSVLDFETNPVFSLVVKVTDDGIGNLTDEATITVNLSDVNENPEINDQSFAIEEYSPNGTEVGTLIATDPDNGQALTYSILSGNENNAFLLNSATGVLTVGNSSALDFETNPVFSLAVKVTDDGTGNLTDEATITVNLTELTLEKEVIPGIVTCKLYPNPAINYIDLRLENISKDQIWISILNLSGETLWHEEDNAESEILMKRLEIGGFSKGVYIIKIKSRSVLFLEKFIKL